MANEQSSPLSLSGRFQFGKNWKEFVKSLTEERVQNATHSLLEMLGRDSLKGVRFLDIGSGSGLFSLAARKLGAEVTSFDFDPDSVSCTKGLRERFFAGDSSWRVSEGSVLDKSFLASLGTFDVVYSWGVLHHTGAMWEALENVIPSVKSEGTLFIAIYNDQGALSHIWLRIKKLYHHLGKTGRVILVALVGLVTELAAAAFRLFTFRNPLPFKKWRQVKEERGMSVWYDLVDWVGGYPFEVAMPGEIFSFFRERGFVLEKLKTKRAGQGCCEYVFRRIKL